ncbi:hypothetical protein [Frankia symbiont of Coriaria ruscifolia]|uniref:hypothetical protein n=1 Tax=Protofrankia symbiont of Coriaria ruscifolia TaxID=1306542 RepID=UPI0010416757
MLTSLSSAEDDRPGCAASPARAPIEVTVDSTGTLYVTNSDNNRVREYRTATERSRLPWPDDAKADLPGRHPDVGI